MKRRPQQVEQVFDDCGSDFTALYTDDYDIDEFFYGDELGEDEFYDEQPYIMMSELFGMLGNGTVYDDRRVRGNVNTFADSYLMDETMQWYYGRYEYDDVAELCGGMSGTT